MRAAYGDRELGGEMNADRHPAYEDQHRTSIMSGRRDESLSDGLSNAVLSGRTLGIRHMLRNPGLDEPADKR